jgi:hypothetical protein
MSSFGSDSENPRPSAEGIGVKAPPNNLPLLGWFFCYVFVTGLLFLFIPRLLGQVYLMPWHYWWVFLFMTPPLAGGILGWQVHKGRFTGLAALIFVLAALLLGLFYRWFSYDLMGAV